MMKQYMKRCYGKLLSFKLEILYSKAKTKKMNNKEADIDNDVAAFERQLIRSCIKNDEKLSSC